MPPCRIEFVICFAIDTSVEPRLTWKQTTYQRAPALHAPYLNSNACGRLGVRTGSEIQIRAAIEI
jgi:hypothetical protein